MAFFALLALTNQLFFLLVQLGVCKTLNRTVLLFLIVLVIRIDLDVAEVGLTTRAVSLSCLGRLVRILNGLLFRRLLRCNSSVAAQPQIQATFAFLFYKRLPLIFLARLRLIFLLLFTCLFVRVLVGDVRDVSCPRRRTSTCTLFALLSTRGQTKISVSCCLLRIRVSDCSCMTDRGGWVALGPVSNQGRSFLNSQLFLFLLPLLLDFFEFSQSLFFLHNHEVLKETVGEVLPHLFKRSWSELVVVVFLVKVTVKACLKSETVHDVEFAPHHDASCLQLRLLEAEPTGVVPELLGLFCEKLGDDSHLEILF